MWPLLLLSVVALAVALERGVVFYWLRTRFGGFVEQLRAPVQAGRVVEARQVAARCRHPVARVAQSYLDHLSDPDALRGEIVARVASQSMAVVERRLSWLSTIGHLAPMLGLLGTVTGLISAFHRIEVHAGHVQPADLASGIWEALLTTVFGLVIALPTLAIHHYFDQRAGAIALEMQWIVAYLNEWLGKCPAPPRERAAAEVDDENAVGIGVSSN